MAKSKKNNKKSVPSVKVQDLAPEKDPKGGIIAVLDNALKLNPSPASYKAPGELVPAVLPVGLNFHK